MARIELRYPKQKPSEEERFLDKYVFYGLKNLNDGFDAMSIKYFCEDEFRTVLDRCEELGISIYGIEPWENGEFYWVLTVTEFGLKANDPAWYRKAFREFASKGIELQYAASYGIPEKLLKDFMKEESMDKNGQ